MTTYSIVLPILQHNTQVIFQCLIPYLIPFHIPYLIIYLVILLAYSTKVNQFAITIVIMAIHLKHLFLFSKIIPIYKIPSIFVINYKAHPPVNQPYL